MDRDRPIVVRPSGVEAAPAAGTPGMERRALFEDGDRWIGWVRSDAGLAGGWHHHGERDSYIYGIARARDDREAQTPAAFAAHG